MATRNTEYTYKARNVITGKVKLVHFINEMTSKSDGSIRPDLGTIFAHLIRMETLKIRHARNLKTGRMIGKASTSSRRAENFRFSKELVA